MKTSKTKQANLSDNQNGFAAIVIAMVLILVLSLLTVGFADLMRTETRNALDKQLASQAYYAAESGINAATEVINANGPIAKKTCGPTAPGPGSLFPSNKVGDNTGSSYPCLLINPTPPTLEYTVGTQQSKITELQGVDSAGNPKAVGSILISWEDNSTGSSFAPPGNCSGGQTNTFLPISGAPSTWTYTGVLRTQLVPIADSILSRDALRENAYTAFLCPQTGGGTVVGSDYNSNKGIAGGGIISGDCKTGTSNSRYCNVKITNLQSVNNGNPTSTFFLDMRSIYSSTNVTIKMYGIDAAFSQLNIAQAQIMVDSTGKAQDVLKRIQVRIPAHNGYAIPDDGVQSMGSICKQLQLVPSSVTTAASSRSGTDCQP